MKLLYFGTLCAKESFEKIVIKSKIKPSAAPYTFESQLMDSLLNNNELQITAYAIPIVASFPNGSMFWWKGKVEKYNDKLNIKWLSAINFHIVKYFTLAHSAKRALKNWLEKNKDEKNKCVLLYSLYLPVAVQIIKQCKKYGCKAIVIVPDLPKHMYKSNGKSIIYKIYSYLYNFRAESVQYLFDGYILFTNQMSEKLSCKNNYIVIEGIIDSTIFEKYKNVTKCDTRSIMYAGALEKRNGIEELLKAFSLIDGNFELWLFGDGDYVSKIKEWQKTDKRIKYFGRVNRETVLEYEKRAFLLTNIRLNDDEYIKYSFPSKTLEYMASETPLIMTKMEGIPKEYYKYVYVIEDIKYLKDVLQKRLSSSKFHEMEFGKRASRFILENKTSQIQSKKIFEYILLIVKK